MHRARRGETGQRQQEREDAAESEAQGHRTVMVGRIKDHPAGGAIDLATFLLISGRSGHVRLELGTTAARPIRESEAPGGRGASRARAFCG
jgi:hypothetical protein